MWAQAQAFRWLLILGRWSRKASGTSFCQEQKAKNQPRNTASPKLQLVLLREHRGSAMRLEPTRIAT